MLCNALWYITNQHVTINSAAEYGQPNVVSVPFAFAAYSGYLNVKRRKIKEQQMQSSELKSHAEALASLLLRPTASSPAWAQFKEDIRSLYECLSGYSIFLDKQVMKMSEYHSSQQPARLISEHCTVIECTKTDSVLEVYSLLDSAVRQANGQPVFFSEDEHLNEPFHSNFSRFNFLQKVHLSVTVDMFRYAPGGSHTTVVCFVSVDSNRSAAQLQTETARFVATVLPKLPVFHTRAMKQNFKRKVENLAKIQPSVVDFLYKELAIDASVASHPDMQQRLHRIYLGEYGLLQDLRVMNPGRPSGLYDVFFGHLECVVNTVTAEDERRHNVAHISQWISLKDLVAQAAILCPPGTLIPSCALVRLQFTPRNPYANTALTFTSRYNVQYKIQRRQLRVSHPDDHFCAALLRYIKTMAITLGPACKLYFCDDKAKVPLGEPDVYLSTGVRGKCCLAPVNSILGAADHDVNKKGSLTPSVLLDCDIPESADKSFVQGQVSVFLNDSIFQASSPFRHAVQLIKRIREKGEIPAVLLKFSDGGTDHRNNVQSVQCSLICIFKELDLELLVAARCAPGQSWTNPVERVMSVLNLGLQNCSLSRTACDDDIEKIIRKCNGMEDVRKAEIENPGLRDAWSASIQEVQQVIRSRFERLSLKDTRVVTQDPVSDADILSVKVHLEKLFPDLDLNRLQKAVVAKNSIFQNWVERHCRQRMYCFQIRKCTDPACCRRKPEVQEIKWLPDPVLGVDKNHYKSFADVYGTETTDCDRPTAVTKSVKVVSTKRTSTTSCTGVDSGNQTVLDPSGSCLTTVVGVTKAKAGSAGVQPLYDPTVYADAGMYTAQNARAIVECVDCRKPRVVYANSCTWISKFKLDLALLLSEYDYTCGAVITPPGHPLHGKVFTRIEMTCESYIELAFYSTSNNVGKKPGLCCYCAAENTPRDLDLISRYKTVLPICTQCKLTGYEPVCMRPFGKATKGKK